MKVSQPFTYDTTIYNIQHTATRDKRPSRSNYIVYFFAYIHYYIFGCFSFVLFISFIRLFLMIYFFFLFCSDFFCRFRSSFVSHSHSPMRLPKTARRETEKRNDCFCHSTIEQRPFLRVCVCGKSQTFSLGNTGKYKVQSLCATFVTMYSMRIVFCWALGSGNGPMWVLHVYKVWKHTHTHTIHQWKWIDAANWPEFSQYAWDVHRRYVKSFTTEIMELLIKCNGSWRN